MRFVHFYTVVAGVHVDLKKSDLSGAVFDGVERDQHKRAMDWLTREVFTAPEPAVTEAGYTEDALQDIVLLYLASPTPLEEVHSDIARREAPPWHPATPSCLAVFCASLVAGLSGAGAVLVLGKTHRCQAIMGRWS